MSNRRLTVTELEPAAMAAWDPAEMGPIDEAYVYESGGAVVADAGCTCPGPHGRHPYVWCPEIGEWDPL